MEAPVHLKTFVRDLRLNLRFSPDGDLCQGLFEDFILHDDLKSPPMLKGHYTRKPPQIQQLLRFIDFCLTKQPGCFTLLNPLYPLTEDASRIIYVIVPKVEEIPNVAVVETTLAEFMQTEMGEAK
jgi:hypothetical protein